VYAQLGQTFESEEADSEVAGRLAGDLVLGGVHRLVRTKTAEQAMKGRNTHLPVARKPPPNSLQLFRPLQGWIFFPMRTPASARSSLQPGL
jgi:hypothetical protein